MTMNITTGQLLESALSLPQSERADLVFQLLQSLEPQGDLVTGEVFGAELRSRVEGYRRGDIESSTWDETREIVMQRLAEGRTS